MSAFLPNSNATNVIGFASLYESRHDLTFDKGAHLNDFWTEYGHIALPAKASLVTSEGLQDSQAVSFTNSYGSDNSISIRENSPHQIMTNSMSLRLHYRVNSYAGNSSTNSYGIIAQALAWSMAPFPPRIPPTIQNTGTYVNMDTAYIPISSLTSTGSWDVLDINLSQDSAWLAGHKLGNFSVGIFRNFSSSSNYLHVYIDNITMRYVG